jgi:hypothetical protein
LRIEAEARHVHITGHHPEGIAQQGQGVGHAARGLQRATKIAPLVQVMDAQAEVAAIAQGGWELFFEVGGVDHHIGDAIARQGQQVPGDQRSAVHGQQGLGRVVGQGAHTLTPAGGQDEGGGDGWGHGDRGRVERCSGS